MITIHLLAADAPTRPTPTDTGEGGREQTEPSVPASSSDDYDEEPDIVSSASQSPILGKSVEHHSFVDEGGNTSAGLATNKMFLLLLNVHEIIVFNLNRSDQLV